MIDHINTNQTKKNVMNNLNNNNTQMNVTNNILWNNSYNWPVINYEQTNYKIKTPTELNEKQDAYLKDKNNPIYNVHTNYKDRSYKYGEKFHFGLFFKYKGKN